jgi:hypothetical protein
VAMNRVMECLINRYRNSRVGQPAKVASRFLKALDGRSVLARQRLE